MITQRTFTEVKKDFTRWDHSLAFSTGKMAVIADGATTVQFDDNVFLVTAVMKKDPDGSKDYLPLMIERRESYSAAGKIGGWRFRKREGRPSDDAVLYARLTDRALRPIYPKGMINDVVITVTPLALDGKQDLGVISIIGASLATMKAGIPFDGPVGAVRIGYKDGNYIINPNLEQIETGQMNLVVAGPKGMINMIECDAHEVSDSILEGAWDIAQAEIDKCIQRQLDFLADCDIKDKSAKVVINKPSKKLISRVETILTEEKLSEFKRHNKEEFGDMYADLEGEVLEAAKEMMADESNEEYTKTKVKSAVFQAMKNNIRKHTIHDGVRLDERAVDQIRPLYCEVDLLPSVHGTALFRRGDTQVLATTTLWSPADVQLKDTMELSDAIDRFMHHYVFPPYSVNDPRGIRGVGRREIGHGKLAEKALEYMIPEKTAFPYTIRVVSECMGSGGSTSMWSVCATTMSLMATGVPIKAPVSGIAMGLMTELEDDGKTIKKYQVLTDIMGTEDFTGDMDFKIAWTKTGVTAIQLDTKLKGVPVSIIKEVMIRGDEGRWKILDFMLQTIAEPRANVSETAPKIHVMTINPKKIKEVIGKGGENIDKIIEAADNVKVDIEDDGTVFLTHQDQSAIDKAIALIKDIAEDLVPNVDYQATIMRVENYGIFIDIRKGKGWLVHKSNIGAGISDVEKRFKVGEKVTVQFLSQDERWKMAFKRVG